MATQNTSTDVLAITQPKVVAKARAITEQEKKFSAFSMLRKVTADKNLWGVREKKAKEKAEAEKNK